jgi:hypothetical protein
MISTVMNGVDNLLIPAMLRHTTGMILLKNSITQFPY